MITRRLTFIASLFGALATRGEGQPIARPISHWQHTSWTGEAAPPPRGELTMLRSPDGYIWMSGIGCLIRFDGVRFTVFDSTTTPALRGATLGTFWASAVDRSGVMWVRGPGGLVIAYQDGQFRVVTRARPTVLTKLIEDGLGRLWLHTDRFQLLQEGRLSPAPLPPGVPNADIDGFERDTGGGIWVGTETKGLWHVVGDSARQYGTGTIRALLQSRDGAVWAIGEGLGRGLWRLAGESWSEVRLPDEPDRRVITRAGVEGADGSVWFQTSDMGVVRWRDGVLERFSKQDGLTSNRVRDVLVDAEGALWATTDAGLDRLRPGTFVPIERANGLPYDAGGGFAEDTSGAVWAVSPGGDAIHLLDGGAIRGRPGPVASTPYALVSKGPHSLLTPSRHGGVWLAPTGGGLVHLRKGGARTYGSETGMPNDRWTKAVETRDGTLWVSTRGVFGRLRNGRYRSVSLAGPEQPVVDRLLADDAGRLWVAAADRRVLRVLDGASDSIVAEVPLPGPDGRSIGALAAQGPDTVWALTSMSLLRIANRRVAEVPLPWLTNDPASSKGLAISGQYLWLASSGGIMRMSLAELDRAANGDSVRIVPTVFGALDGLSVPRTPSLTPVVMRIGKGGRVWIATPNGLAFVDPADRIVNATPPRVHVEELLVAGSVVPLADGGTIQPNPNRVEIRFTAISTVLPERVRIQYRLDGADDRWIDDGGPRLASYSRPGPGDYRFRVRAWNEDGVPSHGEATMQFRILPAWYQSWVFLALCVVGVAGLGAVGSVGWQRGRTRRATERVQARFEAVLAERTRIARELHDTLLQGFTGITLQLEGLRGSLKERAAQSANELAVILGHADTALREAREMVWDMRSPELQDADLASALEQVTLRAANASHVQLLHLVSGTQRRLPPAVEATILRIGREAVSNALQHADPTSVTVHLTFEPRHVMLEVSDDGRGADPAQLAAAPARGHWGIAGMRERAQAAGGTFAVTTSPRQGLKLSVSLPAERID